MAKGAVEVTVMGAGIFGLTIAWTCLARGARVRVIDPDGAGAGASGGVLGALAPHTPDGWNVKKAFQLESLLAAGPFWAEIARVSGQDPGYARTGRVQPLAHDRAVALARGRAEDAARNWRGAADWQIINRAEVGDWVPLSPTGLWLRDTLSALIQPRNACAALAGAIRARGGIVANQGPRQGQIIWATGAAGLAALSDHFGHRVGTAVKGQAALLQLDRAGAAQIFSDGIHIIPHSDGTVAVGATSEREFDAARATDARLDALVERARATVPALAQAAIVERWAGLRPRAASRAPILGPWPRRPGEFIANGGFKIGFGMAIGVARLMADLVLEGRDSIPTEFRLSASMS